MVSGGTVKRLTITIQASAIKNAGTIPGKTRLGSIDAAIPNLSQIIIVRVPESIPAIAPHFVIRFHHRERIITGPNEAAKPPHAKATKK